jgi:hypothetical protein
MPRASLIHSILMFVFLCLGSRSEEHARPYSTLTVWYTHVVYHSGRYRDERQSGERRRLLFADRLSGRTRSDFANSGPGGTLVVVFRQRHNTGCRHVPLISCVSSRCFTRKAWNQICYPIDAGAILSLERWITQAISSPDRIDDRSFGPPYILPGRNLIGRLLSHMQEELAHTTA